MKKLFILLGCITLFSCKKNYVCECTTTYPGSSPATSTSIIKDRSKNAEERCQAKNTTASAFGFTSTTTCTIK